MCKIGDIILIDNYQDNGNSLSKHSFIVIDDQNGTIEGLPYDFIGNVLSSFKNPAQKQRKLAYDGNFPIANDDTITNPDNGKDGYVKTDQLYYFNKSKITYSVIGNIKPEILNLIIDFIQESTFEISIITDNL